MDSHNPSLRSLEILQIKTFWCRGRCRSCMVQACLPNGPLIRAVTVGKGSSSFPSGCSNNPTIVDPSSTKYLNGVPDSGSPPSTLP